MNEENNTLLQPAVEIASTHISDEKKDGSELKTGIKELDAVGELKGFISFFCSEEETEMTTSTVATHIALNTALTNKDTLVIYYSFKSLEIKHIIGLIGVSNLSGLSMDDVWRKGGRCLKTKVKYEGGDTGLTDNECKALKKANHTIEHTDNFQILIKNLMTGFAVTDDFEKEINKLKAQHNVKNVLVVIDDLNNLAEMNRIIPEPLYTLQQIQEKTGVTMIVLSNINQKSSKFLKGLHLFETDISLKSTLTHQDSDKLAEVSLEVTDRIPTERGAKYAHRPIVTFTLTPIN